METPQEFSARAGRLLAEAKSLSLRLSDGYGEVNRWMSVAKQRRMTWVDGLAFSIAQMRVSSGT
jgi:hypothetical protein